MSLPTKILEIIDEAIMATNEEIKKRSTQNRDYASIEMMKNELLEMKQGLRKDASDSMSHIILDSMDWELPCLKNFNKVRQLLRRYYQR